MIGCLLWMCVSCLPTHCLRVAKDTVHIISIHVDHGGDCGISFSSHVCVYLFLSGKPMIVTSPPPLITAEVGRSICLVCDADGINDPEVIWMRGADTLQSHSGDRYNITADRENVRLSHFVVVDTVSSDAGSYQCRAQNFISNATKYFRVSVVSRSGECCGL